MAAVADPRADVAEKAASLAGAEAFLDVATMLDTVRPDLLLVLAADPAHVPIATQAVERGVPCLIEKPLARDYEDAVGLVRLAERQGVLLASVANKRFSPPYAMAKALVDRRALRSAPTVFTASSRSATPMSTCSRAAPSISST